MGGESARERAACSRPPLRRDSQFRRYWLARLGTLAGAGVTVVAMPVLVYQQTGSSFWASSVTAAQGLAYLCFGLFAGVFGDRFDRRRIMVLADLGAAALLGSIPLAYAAGVITAAHVLAVAFAAQLMAVLFDAADFGAMPALVGRDRIPAAQSAVAAPAAILQLAAPGLAGAALAVMPPATLLAGDAAALAASALLIGTITRPLWDRAAARQGRRALGPEIAAGFRFLWRQRVIRAHTVVATFQTFGAGLLIGQIVPWADRTLSVPPSGWRVGALFAAWAFGGVLAAANAFRLIRRLGESRVTLLAVPLPCVAALSCALVGNWLAAMVAVAGWAVGYELLVLTAIMLRQKITPDALQSRVNTNGRMLAVGFGYPLGALAGGTISDLADPSSALSVAAAVLALAIVVAWWSPLRTADPFNGEAPAARP